MKKLLFLTLAWICAISFSAQAQDVKSILTGLLKDAIGDQLTTQQSVVGTWNYKSPACQLDNGNDDLLSKAGNSVVSSTAEGTLTKVYDKVGLDKCTFIFNEDGTYSTIIGKIKAKGNYTFDAEAKTITFKVKLGITVTAKVAVTGSSMTLMFKADKLITAVKAITNVATNLTQYAAVINSLASKYDSLSLGFELAKQ